MSINRKNTKVYFIFPKWPASTLWGHFRYKFPPLGLLTIAGMTPEEYAVSFTDENVTPIDFTSDADIIALSVMTPLAHRSYQIGDKFRALGKTVVMGGIHVSCFPEEALAHADSVVVGEGEGSWVRLLKDYQQGELKKQYRNTSLSDLSDVPVARRNLLIDGPYITKSTIQLTRGCPHNCEFCSVTAFFGRKFRFRSLDVFTKEFASLNDRFVFIVDDNIVSNRTVAAALFDRLRTFDKWWGSQVTITIADDDELLGKMARSGCKSLFIGFESLRQGNLKLMGKNFIKAAEYAERIKKIQDYGIGVLGSFIIGYDNDDQSTFEELYNFIIKTRMEAFLISVLTPFPGTKLAQNLDQEGRILSKDWSLYDMNTVLFRPKNFSADVLQQRFYELNHALYTIPSILKRTLKLRKNMVIFVPQNFGYREAWHKLAAHQQNERLQQPMLLPSF